MTEPNNRERTTLPSSMQESQHTEWKESWRDDTYSQHVLKGFATTGKYETEMKRRPT